MEHNPTKIPSPLLSLVPILVLVTLLFVTIRIFGSDALSGGSQIVLLPDRHDLQQSTLEGAGASDDQQYHWRCDSSDHLTDHWSVVGQLDDKWCRPHFDLLRDADHSY